MFASEEQKVGIVKIRRATGKLKEDSSIIHVLPKNY